MTASFHPHHPPPTLWQSSVSSLVHFPPACFFFFFSFFYVCCGCRVARTLTLPFLVCGGDASFFLFRFMCCFLCRFMCHIILWIEIFKVTFVPCCVCVSEQFPQMLSSSFEPFLGSFFFFWSFPHFSYFFLFV